MDFNGVTASYESLQQTDVVHLAHFTPLSSLVCSFPPAWIPAALAKNVVHALC